MACTADSCQSGSCYKDNQEDLIQSKQSQPNNNNNNNNHLCLKCKSNTTISSLDGVVFGGDAGKFCPDCFRANLFGKFKLAVTSNAMISPTDNVLLAFSGGSSSRVALQFVHEMQHKAQKNFDASRDRSLPVFGVGVAFVDESACYCSVPPRRELDKAIEDMRLIVDSLAPPRKDFRVFPIEGVCASDSSDGGDEMKELLNAIPDATGKEDFVVQLRMLALQKIAIENGYTKIVLGSCTSRIACHVLASTVKGQGYSLAADIQYVDARWETPVVLPLRDCLAQELNMLCRLDSLKTLELFTSSNVGINGLISSFVKLLQEENPSRECTIVRTAGKLTPFQFNRIPEAGDCNAQLASRRRHKKFNLNSDESLSSESLCPICNSPLNKSDSQRLINIDNGHTNHETFVGRCCASCQFQILPKEPASMERFYSLLPQPMSSRATDDRCDNQRWLREQIQDCLLSDSEDGT